ncbi:MAG: beta-galactosidase [Thermoguttaceae bacterium]
MRVSAVLLTLLTAAMAAANDEMYPPAPAAEAAIRVDGRGFNIKGQHIYVASGTIHYPRVPRDLWRDRLLRLKRAGFNAVETYAFWNFQEPRENQWDFTGDKDIGAFLSAAQEVGLYAIVRVGPYVCAEWDSGGYPVWLKFKPPFKVRTADPAFLAWNDHWYDKILPIVAAHQVHKGGNVIMVQLENEHPQGWGTVAGSPYFDHLRKKALSLGIEVPFFFSGLNHGSGPTPGDVSGRKTPWFSTEFWPGWFDLYGNLSAKRFQEVERDNWKILAHGGNGHNFYMLHGGTNFDTWNDDSGAASYDYGAAIGQCGDLRPIYFRMKRANLFAQLLPALREAGATIAFDVNSAKSVTNAPLNHDVKLLSCTARILGLARKGKTITLVVYGPAGDNGSLRFAEKELTVAFAERGPQEQCFTTAGGQTVRVVAVNTALADRTWIVDGYAICGPAFVGDVRSENGHVSLTIERPYGQPSCGKVIVYGDQVHHLAVASDATVDSALSPQLGDWQMRLAPEAAADYDDSGWKSSAQPLQMGADGDTSALAWYRAVVDLKKAGTAKLHFSGSADNAVVLVNGRRYDAKTPLAAGRNCIAVLASHRGRDKAFNYMGTLDNFARKGLFGPVQLSVGREKVDVTPWKLRGGVGPLDGNWQPVAATSGVPAFYCATFTDKNVPGRILRATSKGLTRGTMWLNGHNLGRYPEKIHAPGLYLPECWLREGENTLVVFDEEGAATAPVKLEVETAASREVIRVSQPCDPSTPLVVPSVASGSP